MSSDYGALIREGLVWVAISDEKIDGVLVIRPAPESLLLENVAVAPANQGHGLGRALIRFAEHRAREVGLDEISLYTNTRIMENLALYSALGYVEVDRRSEDGFDRVFFRKMIRADRRERR